MEQLRKALAQARNESMQQQGPASPNSWAGALPNKVKSASLDLGSHKALETLNISYQQTRKIDLDVKHLEANRVLNDTSPSNVEQAYKLLRTQVLQRLVVNEWNSFAVVSPTSGNGKSLTAINLAISLAREVKQSVLLVDLDFRAPKLADYLGINLDKDIADYLLREEALSEVLVNPGLDRLVLLAGHTVLHHSSEVLGSPRLIKLVEELKTRYQNRIVIFDLPPMLEFDDAIAFFPNVDALLMVVEEGKTSPSDLARCADQIGDKPILGTVLNKGHD